MKTLLVLLLFSVVSSFVEAHEMTPTYPKLNPSHVAGVSKAELQMFNRREDVKYYEIGVFDADWKPIPFVSSYKFVKVEYLGHISFEVYIREADKDRARYVCSRSMLAKGDTNSAVVASRICSKFQQ